MTHKELVALIRQASFRRGAIDSTTLPPHDEWFADAIWPVIEGLQQENERFRERIDLWAKRIGKAEQENADLRAAVKEMRAEEEANVHLRWRVAELEQELEIAKQAYRQNAHDRDDVQNRADELQKENAHLGECLEPGKASAIVDGMFCEAIRLGLMTGLEAKHALTFFVEAVEKLKQENADLHRAVEWLWENSAGYQTAPNVNRSRMPDDIRAIVDKVVPPRTVQIPRLEYERRMASCDTCGATGGRDQRTCVNGHLLFDGARGEPIE